MSTNPTPEVTVQHQPAASRFEAVVDGHTAVAEYVIYGGRVVFNHTFVPNELRGRGLAEKLVRAGLAWARAEGMKVVPQCSYVAAFIERHAEFKDLL
ncbi:MAG: N-acetyltransferase [Verrucomicrobia bacterium]|nr:N-acetyltransferase [Verrucomicrobiota bacterium]